MLKTLAITTAFLAVVVSGQPNKTANQKQQDTKQSQPSVLPANSHDEENSSQKNQPKAACDSPSGNAPIERSQWWTKSEWWLLVVTAVTGGVVGWQSWETRKSARAALLNIETLKTVERSRIHIEAMTVDNEVRLEFIFTAVNHGRVPAKLTYYFVDGFILEKGDGFPMPYWSGLDEDNERMDAIWIPPGPGNGFILPSEPSATLYSKADIIRKAPEEWERSRRGENNLFVYGLVRYRDDISPEEHETRFCYMWTGHRASGLMQGGHPEYIKCT